MAEPKKRLTNTRSGNRKSHLAIKNKKFSKCSKCKEIKPSHTVCPNCGTYKGIKIINYKKDKVKKEG